VTEGREPLTTVTNAFPNSASVTSISGVRGKTLVSKRGHLNGAPRGGDCSGGEGSVWRDEDPSGVVEGEGSNGVDGGEAEPACGLGPWA
jgi:hypothetical protein